MDTLKEAEQLYNKILANSVRVNIETDDPKQVREQMTKQGTDLILQSYERICREQRAACVREYMRDKREGLTPSIINKEWSAPAILRTPLLTDNK